MADTMVAKGVVFIAVVACVCSSSTAWPQAAGEKPTATRRVTVDRFSIVSSRPFGDVVARLESTIGRPDMNAFRKSLTAAQTEADVEKVVNQAAGSSGLIEFARYDLGEVLQKESGSNGPPVLRLVVGSPLIMKQMVKRVPDAENSGRIRS